MDGAGNPDLAPREPPETSATPGDKPAHRPPPPPAAAAAPWNPKLNWQQTLIYIVSLGLLTFSVYLARRDPWTLALVVSEYAALVALACSVHAYDAAPPAWKGRMKVVRAALGTLVMLLLLLIFVHHVLPVLWPRSAHLLHRGSRRLLRGLLHGGG